MADKYAGGNNGFGNRTIINMLEQPPSQHAIVGFPGMNGESSPTTFDSVRKHAEVSLSDSDLTLLTPGYDKNARTTSDGVNSGRYYWEVLVSGGTAPYYAGIGIFSQHSTPSGEPAPTNATGAGPGSLVLYGGTGKLYWDFTVFGSDSNSSGLAYVGTSFTEDAVIGIDLDVDNLTIRFSVDGTWYPTHSIPSGGLWWPLVGSAGEPASSNKTVELKARFSSDDLTYTVPSGATAGFLASTGSFATDDSNNMSLAGKQLVTKARYDADVTFQGSIKVLVSFDHRSTWYYINGNEWVDSGGIDFTNAKSIETTMAALEMSRLEAGDTYLDFAIKGFENGYGDPTLSRIDIEVR